MRMLSFWIAATAGLLGWAAPASAAKLFLITRGDGFSHLGEMSGTNRPPQLVGVNLSVGYKYSYVGVFWLDLWRYDGEYCLYQEKNFIPISKGQAASFMGVPEDQVNEPFFYYVPPGLIIAGALLAVGAGVAIARQIRKQKVMALVMDPRYREALDVFRQQGDVNEAATQEAAQKNEPPPENLPNPWEAAIAKLVADGIERAEAEENFVKVVAFALRHATEQATG